MMGKTHIVFGILIGLLSLKYLNVPSIPVFLVLVGISSLLVDLDCSQSFLGKRIQTVSWFIEKLFGHRNFFHSVFPLLILLILFFYILDWNIAGMAVLIGYGSHLIMDSFTHMGISLFYPINKKRIRGFTKTGGVADYLLFFIFLSLDLFLIIRYFILI